jgi:hypothetical protein
MTTRFLPDRALLIACAGDALTPSAPDEVPAGGLSCLPFGLLALCSPERVLILVHDFLRVDDCGCLIRRLFDSGELGASPS